MGNKCWTEYKLEQLTEIIFSGGTPTTSNEFYWNGEYNWLSSGETRNDFIFNTEKTITKLGVEKSSTKLSKKFDVLIASAGQGNTRGQVSCTMIDTYINQSIISLRCKPNLLSPLFLYYNLKGRYNELRKISDGNSVRGSLTTKMLKELPICIPNLKNQIKILQLLYIMDKKILCNNQVNDNLESTAKALYNEWFVNFNFPDENGLPYKDNGGEFVESELGEIPVGWKVVEIGDLCEVTIGGYWGKDKKFDCSTPVICLRGTDLQNLKESGYSSEAPIRWVRDTDLNKRLMDENEVLIGGSGLGPVGRSLCFTNDLNSLYDYSIIYSNFCKRLKFKSKYLAHYTEQILEILYLSGVINNYVNGTSVPNLDINGLLKHKILLPSKTLLVNFSNFKGTLLSSKNLGENKKLNKLKDTLLNKLMSGQIDVDDLDINWDKLDKVLKEVE